jgi:RNA polymerase sigma factor (sigma-70 family)
MTQAPPVAERSTQPPPSPEADFEAFYLAQRARLFRALVVVTRDVHAAEDVAQEAFVRIWERWDWVGRMDDPTGYLYRAALNGWFQVRRQAARAARRVGPAREVIDPLDRVEDRDVLARALLELPARQRAALVFTEYLGHHSAEAGRALGIRPGTVRRLSSKARAALRRRQEEMEEQP